MVHYTLLWIRFLQLIGTGRKSKNNKFKSFLCLEAGNKHDDDDDDDNDDDDDGDGGGGGVDSDDEDEDSSTDKDDAEVNSRKKGARGEILF